MTVRSGRGRGAGSVFADLPTRGKLSLGFGAVLLFLVAVAGLGWSALDSNGRALGRYAEQTGVVNRASEADVAVLHAVAAARAYTVMGTPTAADAARAAITAAQGTVGRLAAALPPEDMAAGGDLRTRLGDLAAGFDRLVELQTSEQTLIETIVNKLGAEIRRALSASVRRAETTGDLARTVKTAELSEAFLLVRVLVARFVAEHNPEDLARIRKDLAKVAELAAAVLVDADGKAAITDGLARYTAGVNEVAAVSAEKPGLAADVLDRGAESAMAAIAAIRTAATADQQALAASVAADVRAGKASALALSALAVLFGIGLAWAIARSIARPLGAMTAAMGRLAEGDLDVAVTDDARRDEIGALARALLVFRTNAEAMRRMEAEQAAEKHRAEEARLEALRGMADTVEREARRAVNAIGERTGGMARDAEGMAAAADRVSVDAQTVAAAAEQARANAQTVAAATEELAASIREITDRVAQSNTVARKAVATGRHAEETIASLSQSVGRIGEVVGLIQAIASQTNLLALNATIEAARAGEAGKGFAVVAQEVKNLATQTARSTDEITRSIEEIQETTAVAVRAVSDIGGTIEEIDQISAAIAAAMEEQAAATAEISRNVVETTTAAQEVSERIAQVSTETDRAGARAAHLRGASGAVADEVANLQQVITRVVRTAMPEVDRRRQPRFRVDEPCRVELGGHETAATVRNLSIGGALLIGVAACRGAEGGTLRLDRFGSALPFIVCGTSGEGLHVEFVADAAVFPAFRAAFERLTEGRQPLEPAA